MNIKGMCNVGLLLNQRLGSKNKTEALENDNFFSPHEERGGERQLRVDDKL